MIAFWASDKLLKTPAGLQQALINEAVQASTDGDCDSTLLKQRQGLINDLPQLCISQDY